MIFRKAVKVVRSAPKTSRIPLEIALCKTIMKEMKSNVWRSTILSSLNQLHKILKRSSAQWSFEISVTSFTMNTMNKKIRKKKMKRMTLYGVICKLTRRSSFISRTRSFSLNSASYPTRSTCYKVICTTLTINLLPKITKFHHLNHLRRWNSLLKPTWSSCSKADWIRGQTSVSSRLIRSSRDVVSS